MQREEYMEKMRSHLRTSYNLPDEKIDTVLPRFLNTLSSHVQQLDQLLDDKNMEDLSKAGHSLKGALLNLGLPELARHAQLIEQECKNSGNANSCEKLIKELQSIISEFT